MGSPKIKDDEILNTVKELLPDCEYIAHYRSNLKHRLMVVYSWQGQEFENRFESIKKGLKTHLYTRFDVPAIYYMYDESGTLLYIGKTMNLSRRLCQHRKDTWFKDEVHKFEVSWLTDADAHIYEPYLINTMHPKYNVEHVSVTPPTVTLPEIKRFDLTQIWRKDGAHS